MDPPSSDLSITIIHHGNPHTLCLPPSSTITDLSDAIQAQLSIPTAHQKFLITPKLGLLRPPFSSNPTLPVESLLSKKIVLLAPTAVELSALSKPSKPSPLPSNPTKTPQTRTPQRRHDAQRAVAEATYTFHTLIPLPYLPSPQRSLTYLERLRSDPGIRSTMIKHRFSVGVLTEMNPAEHTTHESSTLGLNRNRGEVIELRLRTDAYDGYRDYKTIRKTLCHELAHNVFGEHDRQFWDLCGQIEREVERGDWTSGGRALTTEVFYDRAEAEAGANHVDGGGWTGGEFVLGGGGGAGGRDGAGGGGGAGGRDGASGGSIISNNLQERTTPDPNQSLNRRNILAKAAEERIQRQRDAEHGRGGGGG